jgi:hypothetical protein
MHERVREVRVRAAVRSWQFRQRDHAAGVWFHLRRILVDARAAYAISEEDARGLVAEGYTPDPCGRGIHPEKTILFVDEARLSRVDSRRAIAVGLGPDFLSARAVALLAFDER